MRPRAALVALTLLLAACTSVPAVPPHTVGMPPASGLPGQSPATAQPTPSGDVDPALAAFGPSRASVIMQAVDNGRIDLVTGLLYRAYSALGLPGLPDEFAAAIPRADDSVLHELAVLAPTLSAEALQRVRPFIVRPTHSESVFAAQPGALTAGAVAVIGEHRVCRRWADSGNLDSRFKVWACADRGDEAAQADILTIVGMLEDVWEPMTAEQPAGMGTPIGDTFETSDAGEFGGDDRIDFYAVDLGQLVYRDGVQEIHVDGLGQALASPSNAASGNAASGFVLLNRDLLKNRVLMKQNLIHEFFHVLQFAHNYRAIEDGGLRHWFAEASAKWAETYYDREHSGIPHQWFARVFQSSPAGLEDATPEHRYAAYIWPFFMEQEAGPASVFNAWTAIAPVAPRDFAGVTAAVGTQLPFATRFRDFAVRSLNTSVSLEDSGDKSCFQHDHNFPDLIVPASLAYQTLTPGEPFVSGPGGPPPLGAAYYRFEITPITRYVNISLANLSPSDQVDGDALVRLTNGDWQRRRLEGGSLKFCRDDVGDDIDVIYLVVSNHSTTQPILGFFEASAKETCEEVVRIIGDLTWSAEVTTTLGTLAITDTASGSAHIVAEWDEVQGWTLLGDSRYSLDYAISNCTPGASFAGPIVDDSNPPTEGNTRVSIDGGPGEDISMRFAFNNHWMATCDYGGGADDPVEKSANRAFPGCAGNTEATALFDGQRSYVFNCEPAPDMLGSSYTVSGHVQGTLTHELAPSPAP